jgi:aminoglycoside phosphotransferase (APT) family kinase protein
MLPDDALALLQARFPDSPLAEITATSGGRSHPSALLRIAHRHYVVKAADLPPKRADLRRETRVLALLQGSGLPVPPPLGLVENARWTLELLGALPGLNGITFYERPVGELARLAQQFGALLAAVHGLPLALENAPDLDLRARYAQVRTELARMELPADLRGALSGALDAPDRLGAVSLVHGDAGLHNLLWDGARLALLDWEWAGVGSPALDLAWAAWTLRWRQAPPPVWRALLAGYGAGPAAAIADDAAALQTLALAQMAALLTRVAAIPEARDEWLRRVRWTLNWPSPPC